LLNKARTYKYSAANLATLEEIAARCSNPLATRQRIFQWLLFNLLVGNGDNHLKNLSFRVDEQGISLEKFYDLLSTAAYNTRAFAHDHADWPSTALAIELPDAKTFEEVSVRSLLSAAKELRVGEPYAMRELGRMTTRMQSEVDALVNEIVEENHRAPDDVRPFLGAEQRLLSVLRAIVVPDMCAKLRPPKLGQSIERRASSR